MQYAEVLLHVLERVRAAAIERAPSLKLIQKLGVGVDTIDLSGEAAGIAVCNMPGTNTRAVAELALLLMLATLRRLTELDAQTRAGGVGRWIPKSSIASRAWRPHGGAGGVRRRGRCLTPMLQGTGARVLYTSRTEKIARRRRVRAAYRAARDFRRRVAPSPAHGRDLHADEREHVLDQ